MIEDDERQTPSRDLVLTPGWEFNRLGHPAFHRGHVRTRLLVGSLYNVSIARFFAGLPIQPCVGEKGLGSLLPD